MTTTAFEPHDHRRCIQSALTGAEARVRDNGVRLTPVRRRTLEILLERHGAMGAYEVLDRLAAEGFGHQPPVAYRALEFLVENGLVHRIRRLNGFAACTHPGGDHHAAFLICRACNALAEIADAPMQRALEQGAAHAGFTVERASIEALGLCAGCRHDKGAE